MIASRGMTMKKQGRYIDPTTDYGFKRIFGTEVNKDLLLAFLNELFRRRKVIKDLVYNKNEHVGDTESAGSVIFDLTCTAEGGEKFIIEVQRAALANFRDRMVYYGCKLVADQAPKGDRKVWNFGISEVYVIVLMDGFAIPGETGGDGFLHWVRLAYETTGRAFYEKMGLLFVELVKFSKTEEELEDDGDRWFYILKNMSDMDSLSAYLRKPIFEKLFEVAEYSKLNKEEREMYDVSLKRKWDNAAALEQARSDGLLVGRSEARAHAEEEKRLIAINLKNMGVSPESIAKSFGLSFEDPEKL